jgi:hypothetical protein
MQRPSSSEFSAVLYGSNPSESMQSDRLVLPGLAELRRASRHAKGYAMLPPRPANQGESGQHVDAFTQVHCF